MRILNGTLLTLLTVTGAQATEYVTTTTLTMVGGQAERPIQPSTNNTDYVNFATGTTWTPGGLGCSTAGAALPANNPTLRAVALAAIASGARVQVHVDDSLPYAAGVCRITMLFILANS